MLLPFVKYCTYLGYASLLPKRLFYYFMGLVSIVA
jgi:hypothetical protein